MNQDVIFLGILVIGLIAVAHFTTLGGGLASPLVTAPNPRAEFGVVRQQDSVIRPPSSRPTAPPPVAPPPPPTRDGQLERMFSLAVRNAKSRNINEEYVDIVYTPGKDTPRIDISGWSIGDSKGESYKIGQVSNLPAVFPLYNQDRLVLDRPSKIHIVTGHSPIGENFRLNKCAPYLTQYRTFTPGISASCPVPSREGGQDHLSEACFKYVRTLSSCRIPQSIPLTLDNTCREYISRTASYDACVKNHRNDSDFYLNEWWIYLNRPQQVWSDVRDTIVLRNEQGVIVKSLSYQ